MTIKQSKTKSVRISLVLKAFSGLLLLCLSSVSNARVEALLDRSEVFINETATLVIESTVPQGPSPDLVVLRDDFDVTVGNTSTRTKLINGEQFSLTRWSYQLKPKKLGEFTIPAIVVRGEITVPKKLKVSPVPDDIVRANAEHAMVEMEVLGGDLEPYVQQQLILSLRLFYDDTVTSGESTDPVVEDAVIEAFRGEQTYTIERDGRQFHVYEQRFVISAEASGELTIPPVTFSGTRASGQKDRREIESSFEERVRRMLRGTPLENDPFFIEENYSIDRSSSGIPFAIPSNELRLNIRPRPEQFKSANWLPAQNLIIEDSWAANPPSAQVGQPIKRTLLVRAKGLMASQIPELDIQKPDAARMYMEPPFSDTPTDSRSINGQREHTITYIPDAAGRLVIPEVVVDWWNVLDDTEQVARVDAVTLDVLPAVASDSQAPDQQTLAQSALNTLNDLEEESSESVSPPDTDSSLAETVADNADELVAPGIGFQFPVLNGRMITKVLILSAILAALVVWIRLLVRSRQEPVTARATKNASVRFEQNLHGLQRAIEGRDAPAASRCLLQLAEARWRHKPPKNLASLRRLLDRENFDSTPVVELERFLFSADGNDWNAGALRSFLNRQIWVSKKKVVQLETTDLKPLYPRKIVAT